MPWRSPTSTKRKNGSLKRPVYERNSLALVKSCRVRGVGQMRQTIYSTKLKLMHYIDQNQSLVAENQRLQLKVLAMSSDLDTYKAAVQQEHVLSQSHKNSMEEWKLEATNLREELARTQELQTGAECELIKYARYSMGLGSS